PPEVLRDFLLRIARWDTSAWTAHGQRWIGTYPGPMPFLPPECASAVVLQASLGQSGHFGSGLAPTNTLYRRPPDEFRQHAQEVATLWGRRLLQARTVFVAGLDVLQWPAAEVQAYLTNLTKVFPITADSDAPSSRVRKELPNHTSPAPDPAPHPDAATPHFDSVHIPLNDSPPRRPDRDHWKLFAAAGLKRVSIGIASGDPAIRALYHQHWSDQDLRAAV